MKYKLYYDTLTQCSECNESKNKEKQAFRYVKSSTGEKFVFDNLDTYTIVFILSGEALISCNEFINVPFKAGELCLFPISADCVWETISDATGIVLATSKNLNPCDRDLLKYHADQWLNTESTFFGMAIKPRLLEFLESVRNYIEDGIECPYIHRVKEQELSMIFRAYYSTEERSEFFLPTVRNTHEFEYFIMQNYLKMKGVMEFVDLSGLNISTFNRKFKSHFGTSPYQWMIKQKSKHILHALITRDKTIADVMRDFNFSDASHFNRYCKSMFGASPTELRKQRRNREIEHHVKI